jgi:hypothetical protein
LQHGSPLPKLVWKKDGDVLPNQTYHLVDSTYSRATLHIKVSDHDRRDSVIFFANTSMFFMVF